MLAETDKNQSMLPVNLKKQTNKWITNEQNST